MVDFSMNMQPYMVRTLINPLTPDIKEQILLSCPHTFLIKVMDRNYYIIKKIHHG